MKNISRKKKTVEYYDKFAKQKNASCLKSIDTLLRREIKSLNALPSDEYVDAAIHMLTNQLTSLYKKNASLIIDPNLTRDNAYASFVACEFKNKVTNERFRKYHDSNDLSEFKTDNIDGLIWSIRKKIDKILGPVPSYADLNLRFGPGETTNCKRFTTSRYKLSVSPMHGQNVTQDDLEAVLETLPHYAFLHYKNGVELRVGSGELFFVPKNAETDRTCERQSLLNSLVQKGIGSHMKDRFLKVCGVDLSDQTVNASLARWGSFNNCISTIDLKDASNSLALWVVYTLLPPDWFDLLNTWRSPKYDCEPYGVKNREFELFSSMGNGFTFELESIIFYTISRCIMEQVTHHSFHNSLVVSIFGDDLVIESEYYDAVTRGLEDFGFTVNSAKSYRQGPFRESCGGDYLRGIYVRPFSVKDTFTPARLVGLYNHYFDLTDRSWLLMRSFRRKLLNIIYRYCKPDLLLEGPKYLGDGHIHSFTVDYEQPRRNKRNQYDAVCFKTYGIQPRVHKQCNLRGDLLDHLYHLQPTDAAGFRLQRYGSHVSQRNVIFSFRETGPERDPYTLRGGDIPCVTTVTVLPSTLCSDFRT